MKTTFFRKRIAVEYLSFFLAALETNIMKLGMMQPYFYPYLGYWQLMNCVDEYIIYDDVNYIKNGWINRNRIKVNGAPAYVGISVKKASQNRKINEHVISMSDSDKESLLTKVKMAYGKAPYFKDVYDLFKDTVYCEKTNLAEYLMYSNLKIADFIGITTKIYSATELGLDHTNKAQERIIDICRLRGASEYINAIGGEELYDKQSFNEAGIKLNFLKMDADIVYPQGKGQFIPSLSILDVLMYNSNEETLALLNRYSIE